jgi:hypothetical protein
MCLATRSSPRSAVTPPRIERDPERLGSLKHGGRTPEAHHLGAWVTQPRFQERPEAERGGRCWEWEPGTVSHKARPAPRSGCTSSGPTATLAPDPVLMRTTEVTSVTFTMTPSQDGVVLVRTADK